MRNVPVLSRWQNCRHVGDLARLPRLLSLLQTPRVRAGAGLARRLGGGTRTVRNDVERLRALGYPVHGHAWGLTMAVTVGSTDHRGSSREVTVSEDTVAPATGRS